MRPLEITLRLEQYILDELPSEDRRLVEEARKIAQSAYAPYSRFLVGCALLLDNGQIITGNNQENAAYPSGLCAERVALFAAGSQFPGMKVITMAICVLSENKDDDRVYAPCGACRQVISEYQNKQETPVRIIFEGPGEYFTVANGIQEIMPFTFRLFPQK